MKTEELALVVAIISLFIGPFVAYRIAIKQLKAQVHSVYRQKWIDNLSSKIGLLTASIYKVILAYKYYDRSSNTFFDSSVPHTWIDDVRTSTDQIYSLNSELGIILNPDNPDEKELTQLITIMANTYHLKNNEEVRLLMNEIVKQSKKVISNQKKLIKNLK